MIWVTWRQHRLEALGAVLVLGVIAALLVLSRQGIDAAFHSVDVCLGLHDPHQFAEQGCVGIISQFQSGDANNSLISYLNFIPALVGLFVGAPLVAREIEHRTHLLAWTQSASKLRWISVKLILISTVTTLISVAFVALMTWWRNPFDRVSGRFTPNGFDFEGFVPVAYTLFALAVGTAVGTVVRRIVPAMAVTLLAFLVVRLPAEYFLRARYEAPVQVTLSLTVADPHTTGRGDWIISSGLLDPAGHQLSNGATSQAYTTAQALAGSGKGGVEGYLQAHGYRSFADFQPADRFWTFQSIEAAIFVGLALLMFALTIVWLSRRTS